MTIQYKNKYISYYGFALILLILLSPVIVLTFNYLFKGDNFLFLISLYRIITNTLLLLLPLIIFRIPLRTYSYILSPIAFLVPGTIIHILLLNKTPSRWFFCMLFNLDGFEISEFLRNTYWLVLFSFILPLIIITIGYWGIKKHIYPGSRFRKTLALTIIALFIFTYFAKIIQRRTAYQSFKTALYTCAEKTPIQTIVRLKRAYKNCKRSTSSLSFKLPDSYRNNPTDKQEVFVLVLGESSRYVNWNINGYPINTSPNLDTIKGILSFSNVIAPSFNTLYTIPYLLTDKSVRKNCKQECTTIIDLFKQAGFRTYWIGYNFSKGNVVGNFANCSDHWLIPSNNTNNNYDSTLLPLLDSVVKTNSDDLFIILHTLGSHYPYQNRYPNHFAKFKPALTKNKHIIRNDKDKQAVINSYDNTIAYTDFIISEIIKVLNDTTLNALMYYISDHGENLFDNNNNGFGRGYGNLSPNLFHIPLFVWSNIQYQSQSDSWEALILNKDKPTSSTNTIFTLSDLAGINWEQYDSTKSLASEKYSHFERKVLIKGDIKNFDSLKWSD